MLEFSNRFFISVELSAIYSICYSRTLTFHEKNNQGLQNTKWRWIYKTSIYIVLFPCCQSWRFLLCWEVLVRAVHYCHLSTTIEVDRTLSSQPPLNVSVKIKRIIFFSHNAWITGTCVGIWGRWAAGGDCEPAARSKTGGTSARVVQTSTLICIASNLPSVQRCTREPTAEFFVSVITTILGW